jgi:hypothetical protein
LQQPQPPPEINFLAHNSIENGAEDSSLYEIHRVSKEIFKIRITPNSELRTHLQLGLISGILSPALLVRYAVKIIRPSLVTLMPLAGWIFP